MRRRTLRASKRSACRLKVVVAPTGNAIPIVADAYRHTGPWFVSGGAGIEFTFGSLGFDLGLSAMLPFPHTALVFEPNLGIVDTF